MEPRKFCLVRIQLWQILVNEIQIVCTAWCVIGWTKSKKKIQCLKNFLWHVWSRNLSPSLLAIIKSRLFWMSLLSMLLGEWICQDKFNWIFIPCKKTAKKFKPDWGHHIWKKFALKLFLTIVDVHSYKILWHEKWDKVLTITYQVNPIKTAEIIPNLWFELNCF